MPVGAVILDADGRLCAAQANKVESDGDLPPCGVARDAGGRASLWDEISVGMHALCHAGAMSHVRGLYGAFQTRSPDFWRYDPKGGGVEHGPRIFEQKNCLHRPEVIGGVRAEESAALLTGFFSRLRAEKGVEKL